MESDNGSTREKENTMTTAEKINQHLEDGGVVQVTTCTKSWIYKPQHTGWFSTGADGECYVQHGNGKNCLTTDAGKVLLVSIKFGHYQTTEG